MTEEEDKAKAEAEAKEKAEAEAKEKEEAEKSASQNQENMMKKLDEKTTEITKQIENLDNKKKEFDTMLKAQEVAGKGIIGVEKTDTELKKEKFDSEVKAIQASIGR